MTFFLTLYWTQSLGLRQSPWGSPGPRHGWSCIVQVTQSGLCGQRGKNCLSFSWCLLHCFRWSRFLTHSFASGAYSTLVYLSGNFPCQVFVIWLWEINGDQRKQSCFYFLMYFFHWFQKFGVFFFFFFFFKNCELTYVFFRKSYTQQSTIFSLKQSRFTGVRVFISLRWHPFPRGTKEQKCGNEDDLVDSNYAHVSSCVCKTNCHIFRGEAGARGRPEDGPSTKEEPAEALESLLYPLKSLIRTL